jgi:endonuclease/exonuclease/phosphatase family metal-dependent hydrolase
MGARLVASIVLALVAFVGSGGSPATASGGADRDATLRILSYNIHHGAGNDEVLDLERIARLVRSLDPHLVALQEVDKGTERTGGVDQAAELGRLTGMSPVFGTFMDYQGGEYGMAVLSALPIVGWRNHRLPEGPEPRSALAARVRLPGDAGELTFVGIHLYRTAEERLAQARRLLEVLPADEPVILAGDFNSTPESAVMTLVRETFTIPDKGSDHFTFPSHRADREIDFMAWRPAGRFTAVESRVIDEPVASDHRPVLLVVEIR